MIVTVTPSTFVSNKLLCDLQPHTCLVRVAIVLNEEDPMEDEGCSLNRFNQILMLIWSNNKKTVTLYLHEGGGVVCRLCLSQLLLIMALCAIYCHDVAEKLSK